MQTPQEAGGRRTGRRTGGQAGEEDRQLGTITPAEDNQRQPQNTVKEGERTTREAPGGRRRC